MKVSPWLLSHHDGQSQSVEVDGQFIANNIGLLTQLARNGKGIVATVENWTRDDVAQNKLVRVLPDWAPPQVQVFALTTTRLLPAKVRVLIDYLVERMA
jgi:DNA-binding transcriptional LysR family regulator